MVKTVAIDIETERIVAGKEIENIWCIVCIDVDTKEREVFLHPSHRPEEKERFNVYTRDVGNWVGHNALAFDIPICNRLCAVPIEGNIRPDNVIDTLVVSRLVNFSNGFGHSLEAWGTKLGFPKIEFDDYSKLTEEMVEYCIRDVEVTIKLYHHLKRFIKDSDWAKALRIEHDMVTICEDMKKTGFRFDKKEAEVLLDSVVADMTELEAVIQEAFPIQSVLVTRIRKKRKLDGELYAVIHKAYDRYDLVKEDGDELLCYEYHSFSPASPIQRIDRLWEAGWAPFTKTKGHTKFLRLKPESMTPEIYAAKKARFERYGWSCNEDNLSTLPESAPEGALALSRWLTLEGRRSRLREWLTACQDDGRIHGTFWHIGSWTGRMAHSAPNQANISRPFKGEPKTPVEEIKAKYDGDMRALWGVTDGSVLVGTDADGIQLRILAHLLKNDEYVKAITEGDEEDGTDIHNVNRAALGLAGTTRDSAKTFIYAWLLGAGIPKVANILQCRIPQASEAVRDFTDRIDGLKTLRTGRIPYDARRGFFKGLDGRRVICRSEHLMLAGYLQNGEAVIMKHANKMWKERALRDGISFKQVDFVHDEWQTECPERSSVKLGEIQCWAIRETGKDLGLYCPLAGSTKIGYNWKETH